MLGLVGASPAGLPAQGSSNPAPNPAFAGIAVAVRRTLSGRAAFATTNYVQQFYRDPGSRGFDAALDTVARLLTAAGYQPWPIAHLPEQPHPQQPPRFTYRIEARPASGPVWSPLGASIVLAGHTVPLEEWSTNHNMLPSNSWSTPPGGVDAEVVDVGDGSDSVLDRVGVRGKIVYSASPARAARRAAGGGGLTRRAAARGAVGVLVGQRLPAYNQQEKNRTAITFTGIPYDTTARIFTAFVSLAARDTLNAALRLGPVRARVAVSTVFENRPVRTLIAEIRGAVTPDERFVFSAHVQEPGANDNATGVGLLAEMARTAADLVRSGRVNPGRTITMIWGVEIEQTREFIAADSVRRRGIRWGMSLDMVGENTALTGGTFLIEKMPDPSKIWVRGEDQHTEWGAGAAMTARDIWPYWYNDFVKQRCVDESRATGGSWIVRANPYEGGSDHTPFITAGIPGVLLWHFTDQNYHDDLDRIGMVSPVELAHVGNCALTTALIVTAANHPEYARATLDELSSIAERRLGAEAEISRDTLRNATAADSTRERTILTAWRDYYVAALAKVPEMTLPHLALASDVAAAQLRVRHKAAAVLASLGLGSPD